MSNPCRVCTSPSAGTIDGLLRSGRPAVSVAAEFSVSARSMQRHASRHLNRTAALPFDVVDGADPLSELVASLRPRALAGDPQATREYRLALLADKAARAAAPATNYADSAEWAELRTRVLTALEPFPEARVAVAEALAEAER